MKIVVKLFFRTLRFILGPFMLFWERMTQPKGIFRAPELQRQIDQDCQPLTLYQFRTCPFCIKVRQEMRRLSLDIRCLDAQYDEKNRNELLKGGGEIKVPCLRIPNASGADIWLYESGKIIGYLRSRWP